VSAGRLGDLVGRKRVFLTGVGIFTAASMLCGVAPTETTLVLARFLQGVGAAVVSSMVLGILVTLFAEPRDTARAMSLYAFVASAGGAIGLLLGGVLTEALNWHWIFFINLPIGLATLVLGTMLIPGHVGIGVRGGVDGWGALLITAAPALAVYTILQASSSGWGSVSTMFLGGLTVVLSVAFILVEARVRHPLVPLHFFRSRNVAGAALVRALFLFLTARLVGRIGAKATLLPGLLLVAGGLLLFGRAPVNASYAVDVLPAMLLMGMGSGLVFMPTVSLAMGGVNPRDSGLASGVANVAMQMGAAIGIAVIATVSAAGTNGLLAKGDSVDGALTGGYHLGFTVAAACVAVAAVAGAVVLRNVHPHAVPAARPAESLRVAAG
jgi:MFS family permease